MQSPPPKLQVFYNSACPVCDAGIRNQQGLSASCSIEWIDVHSRPEALEALGLDLETVRERLHVKDAAGRLHVGADALGEIWQSTPRQRWLAWLARRGAWLARPLYNSFARLLYRWNLGQKRWTAPAKSPKEAA